MPSMADVKPPIDFPREALDHAPDDPTDWIVAPVELKQAAREEGMTFLCDSALEKVFSGVTTLREINKVTFVL